MERMKKEELKKELEKLKDFKVYVFEGDVYVKAEDYKEKAIENKNLKEEIEIQKKLNLGERMEYLRYIDELGEENKKLNIKVSSLEGEIKGLNSVIDKLHKEIEEQEAEGHGLFDEIDYRKREAKRLGWKPNN